MLYDQPYKEQLGDEKHPTFGFDVKVCETWREGKMGQSKELDDPGMSMTSDMTNLIDTFNVLFG